MAFVREVVFYEDHFMDFHALLRPEAQRKIDWTLKLIATVERVPTKYFKHMEGTNGLYEVRVDAGREAFRILCFFDEGRLMVLLNGFRRRRRKHPWARSNVLNAYEGNITMKSNKPKLTSLNEHLDRQYGKRGTVEREHFEEEFESFRLGAILQAMRKEKGLTQEQLAERAGTTKHYISRIENDASDIRLSTLLRIIRDGLGGKLRLSIE